MRSSAFHKFLCSATMVFLLSGVLFAQTDERITIHIEKLPVQKLFTSIESQSGYRFIYTNEQIKNCPLVTVIAERQTVEEILKKCCTELPLLFTVEDKFIIVRAKEKEKQSTGDKITGIVKNEAGSPVAGVTIAVAGSLKGTVTEDDGSFALEKMAKGATIVFTGTNVERKEIIYQGQQFMDIVLKIKTSRLDEVQIIAYGTTTKKLNTGDVSTVHAETIAEQPVSNTLAALEGRAPGLIITQSSGTPGSGFTVQIRGQNSISSGNDPLYVIDGVPYTSTPLASAFTSSIIAGGSPLSSINPSDIESVSILKDADATSIYGSRGANGVILITTKKGKSGQTKTDLNSYYGVGKMDRKIKLLNTKEYLEMRNEAFKNDGTLPSLSNGDYDLLSWDTTRYTDWQKVLLGNTAKLTDLQLNISGGNSYTQFSFGGGFHRETSVFPGDYANKKGSGRFSLNHRSMNNRFKLDLSVVYGVENSNLPAQDFLSQAISLPPNAPDVYTGEGKLNWPPGFDNPFSYIQRTYNSVTNNLISHAVLNYKVTSEWEVRLGMGYNHIQIAEKQIVPLTSVNPAYGAISGNSTFSNGSVETWILEPQTEYQKRMGPGRLNILLGMTFQQDVKTSQTTMADGFSSDALLENIAAASSIVIANNNYTQYHYAALFGRLNYNIDDKYILNLTARRDGSSRFGPGKQFANFGALGAGWIFSKNRLVASVLPFLSFGKLRASYGITGNDQIGDYQYLSTYSSSTYPYQNAPGLLPTSLYNADYAWETTKKFEAGLDLGFLKDRILLSVSYYNNHTSNQLIGAPLPYITGFGSVQSNLPAVVRNTGFEFSLSYEIIKTESFNWTVNANLTIPQNKLVSFPNIVQSGYNNTYQVGEPLSTHKLFHYAGVDPATGIYLFESTAGGTTLSPVYPDDLMAIKKLVPDYYGGLQNSFQYKGWRLDIFFQFTKQLGSNFIRSYYTTPGMLGNQPVVVLNRWQKPGDNTRFQKFSQSFDSAFYGYVINSALYGDNAISDASFIRLKNVSLSYSFPTPTLLKWKMQNLRVYLQGQNLLTFTHYFGLDPENQSTLLLPPLRMITGGIQITF